MKSILWSFPWQIKFQYRKDRHEGYLEIVGWYYYGIAFSKNIYSLYKVMKIYKFKKWYFWFYNNKPWAADTSKDKPSPDKPFKLDMYFTFPEFYK